MLVWHPSLLLRVYIVTILHVGQHNKINIHAKDYARYHHSHRDYVIQATYMYMSTYILYTAVQMYTIYNKIWSSLAGTIVVRKIRIVFAHIQMYAWGPVIIVALIIGKMPFDLRICKVTIIIK